MNAASRSQSSDSKVAISSAYPLPPEVVEALVRGRVRQETVSPTSGLNSAACWQALRSRDPRFDGRFFVGVQTSRVYCRSTCPVPLHKPENLRWFPSAASAEGAGFRPCKRCRPHTSPGTPAWFGTSSVVSRALKFIFNGVLDSGDVEELAAHVGLGARHLRRLFVQHLGAPPARVARTRRIHLARSLIEETDLPITKIAFYSGFRSIREFNHAMRTAFDQSPSELRRMCDRPSFKEHQGVITLFVAYRPPLDWTALINFLAPKAIPGVEVIESDCYRRTIESDGEVGEIEVRPDNSGPRLRVDVRLSNLGPLLRVIERVRRMFDAGADPLQIAQHLSRSSRLKPFVEKRPGLRLPGVWDGFEFALLAILDMQLTARNPQRMIESLVKTFGTPLKTSTPGLHHLFPKPEQMTEADLSIVGIRGGCARAIRSLARALLEKRLTFDTPKSLEDALSRLCAVRALGERERDYIAMRVFGEPDAFPPWDHVLRRAVSTDGTPVSPAELLRISESWRPWRAYAAMHLWVEARSLPSRRGAIKCHSQSLSPRAGQQ